MLAINQLTYRVAGRLLLNAADATIPAGHKVGLVGRNGTGKSTLLHLIDGSLTAESGSITLPKHARIGQVAQEAPGGARCLLDTVLAADEQRTSLLSALADAESRDDGLAVAELHQQLQDIEAQRAPARAARILAGLGFDEAQQQQACADFSGGWRMRVALASVLFLQPDLLLLDEPTNYLDLEGVLWLEAYLKNYPHSVLLVSHDRDLLNRAVDGILHLHDGKLTTYRGGYDAFERARQARAELDAKAQAKQQAKRQHMQAFVDRFRYKASKARQAQSRLKAIAKLQPIAALAAETRAKFVFPSPNALAPPLITLHDAAVGYTPGKPVLRRLRLQIDPDDRIALLGRNGNGKSTFAKLLAGALQAESGDIERPAAMRVGYFGQHQIEMLSPAKTAFEHLSPLLPKLQASKVRARLGGFGLSAEKADTLAEHLSGGEQARLVFAMITVDAPHLLILDEPTNHLDVDARAALAEALNDYEGAVLLISHDSHLVNLVAERLWHVADNTIQIYDADLDDYRAQLLGKRKRDEEAALPLSPSASTKSSEKGKKQRQRNSHLRAQLKPLRDEIKRTEAQMQQLTKALQVIDKRLQDDRLYQNDKQAVTKLNTERAATQKALDIAEERWLAANEALEQAELQ